MATLGQKYARHAGALNRIEDIIALPVTATANTDYQVQIPAGARNVTFSTITTTAYGAATDAQVSIGKTVGGAEYVAAVSIKALGKVLHTLATTNIADLDTLPGSPGSMTTVNVRVVQSGTASATGAANLYVGYSLPL